MIISYQYRLDPYKLTFKLKLNVCVAAGGPKVLTKSVDYNKHKHELKCLGPNIILEFHIGICSRLTLIMPNQ